MKIRRIESVAALVCLLAACKPIQQGSDLAVVQTEYCNTSVASKIVRIQPARISNSIIVYNVDNSACGRSRVGLGLADPAPQKQPVVLLYYPSKTNLSADLYQAGRQRGVREIQPELQGSGPAGEHVAIGERDAQRIIMPRLDRKASNAYPESSFAEKEAMTLHADLVKAGVPVKLIDASQADAQITAQTSAFLAGSNAKTYNLAYVGHSSENQDGRLEAGRTVEDIYKQKVTPETVSVADKMNAVMKGSNIQPYCISRSCNSGSLVDDGLDAKAKQLMTFSTPKTVASSITPKDPTRYADGMTEILRDHLINGQDQDGNGQVDLKDLKASMDQDPDRFKIQVPIVEVRTPVFTEKGKDPSFIALGTQQLPATPSGPAQDFPGQDIFINGQPAKADVRVTPGVLDEKQQIQVYERGQDGNLAPTEPAQNSRPAVMSGIDYNTDANPGAVADIASNDVGTPSSSAYSDPGFDPNGSSLDAGSDVSGYALSGGEK